MAEFNTEISRSPLEPEEKSALSKHILELGLDPSIWELYDNFMESGTRNSIPVIYKLRRGDVLLGAAFLLECYDYGPTISNSKLISAMVRSIRLPVYVWMKSSIGAELFANPGFYNLDHPLKELHDLFMDKISREFTQLFVLDLEEHGDQYPGSLLFPYPDEGIVDTSGYKEASDYLDEHSNLKKKIRTYGNKGGRIDLIRGALDDDLREKIYDSVVTTGENSVFTLPYQDAYPGMCRRSAGIEHPSMIHFVCRSDQEFFGYHSFMEFDDHLRCLNGAFNRRLKSTFHAYENMILKVVEYAVQQGKKKIYFGPVLNETKRRMMNEFHQTKVYFLSRNPLYLKLAAPILRVTKMQHPSMLRFSGCASKSVPEP